nr:hypothetical protein BaRGS_026134 [Batillaria attramentaria]
MVSNSTIGVTPSYPALVATFTLYALPLLVGVAGNASIVYIIAYNKSLRTGVNAYIANMAALDLLACVMLVPLRMAFYTMDSNTHFSSEIFCRADVFFRSVTDSGRVILLSAVSFERYQTVARPFQRDKAAAARRAFITLAIVWAAIIVTAALLSAVTGKDAALSSNVVNVVEMDGTAHLERLENVENVHGDVCVLNTKNRLQGRRRVEGRVAKRLVVLFLTFLLLWLPFPFAVLYIRINHFTPHGHMPWKEGVEQKVTDILAVLSALTTVTAAVNPVFYGLASSNIRSAIHSKLTSAIRWWRPAQ